MQASEDLPASAREPDPAAGRRSRHSRRGRLVKVLALGGVVALVTKEDVRSRLLDVLFGPEEQFEYDSVTEPMAPGIEPKDAASASQYAADVSTADAAAQHDALWSTPSSHTEAWAPPSIAHETPPASDEAPSAVAETTAPLVDDASASAYEARPEDDVAPAYDAPTPVYDAPTPAYESPTPAYESPTPAYEAPAPAYEAPAPAYEAPAPAYESPAPA